MAGYLKLPEVDEEDFFASVDRESFLRTYGNPVIVHSRGQRDLVCMAREYYERLMTELDMFIEDENIEFWVYEFSATEQKKLALERAAAKCCMTLDEFIESAVEDGLRTAETDPTEWERRKGKNSSAEKTGIHLVRYYPVYKDETEAQAYQRKLAKEAAERQMADAKM